MAQHHPTPPPPPIPSLQAIRSHFPALTSSTTFLDNAGGSQLPACVIEAMAAYLSASYAQIGGSYPESLAAANAVHDAHVLMARWANAADESHAILGPSDSALVRMLADAYLDAGIKDGRDEVIVSIHGHESNIGPWVRLEKFGWKVTLWSDLPVAGEAFPDSLRSKLSKRTKLVVFPHVSNILGSVVNVRTIADMAHAAGALLVVDGVAFAPHRAIDVQAFGADWYSWSTYKVLGPHAAVLVGSAAAMAEVTGPNHFFMPANAWPKKFELGGVSHEACAGMVAVQPYLHMLAGAKPSEPPAMIDRTTIVRAMEVMTELELGLQERLIHGLLRVRGLKILGPTETGISRVPTVSFVIPGKSSRAVATAANANGLAMRYGQFYSHRLVSSLLPGGDVEDGVLRISLVHYNSATEVDGILAFLTSHSG